MIFAKPKYVEEFIKLVESDDQLGIIGYREYYDMYNFTISAGIGYFLHIQFDECDDSGYVLGYYVDCNSGDLFTDGKLYTKVVNDMTEAKFRDEYFKLRTMLVS